MNRRLALEVEAGYASADRNPEDNTLNRFTFDDNFGVGMILFPSLLRMNHETSVEQASDLSRVGQPQRDRAPQDQGRVAGRHLPEPPSQLSLRARQPPGRPSRRRGARRSSSGQRRPLPELSPRTPGQCVRARQRLRSRD